MEVYLNEVKKSAHVYTASENQENSNWDLPGTDSGCQCIKIQIPVYL